MGGFAQQDCDPKIDMLMIRKPVDLIPQHRSDVSNFLLFEMAVALRKDYTLLITTFEAT